jgi:hypothetical protein
MTDIISIFLGDQNVNKVSHAIRYNARALMTEYIYTVEGAGAFDLWRGCAQTYVEQMNRSFINKYNYVHANGLIYTETPLKVATNVQRYDSAMRGLTIGTPRANETVGSLMMNDAKKDAIEREFASDVYANVMPDMFPSKNIPRSMIHELDLRDPGVNVMARAAVTPRTVRGCHILAPATSRTYDRDIVTRDSKVSRRRKLYIPQLENVRSALDTTESDWMD